MFIKSFHILIFKLSPNQWGGGLDHGVDEVLQGGFIHLGVVLNVFAVLCQHHRGISLHLELVHHGFIGGVLSVHHHKAQLVPVDHFPLVLRLHGLKLGQRFLAVRAPVHLEHADDCFGGVCRARLGRIGVAFVVRVILLGFHKPVVHLLGHHYKKQRNEGVANDLFVVHQPFSRFSEVFHVCMCVCVCMYVHTHRGRGCSVARESRGKSVSDCGNLLQLSKLGIGYGRDGVLEPRANRVR